MSRNGGRDPPSFIFRSGGRVHPVSCLGWWEGLPGVILRRRWDRTIVLNAVLEGSLIFMMYVKIFIF